MSMILGNTHKEVSPQDNVVNFNTPKLGKGIYKTVDLRDMRAGIVKKELLYSTDLERLQIKSIGDQLHPN